jgi:hypothetical protein
MMFQSSNEDSQLLLRAINMSGKLHMVPAVINDNYVIRFAVCSPRANDDDMKYAWAAISDMATQLALCPPGAVPTAAPSSPDTVEVRSDWLSNLFCL